MSFAERNAVWVVAGACLLAPAPAFSQENPNYSIAGVEAAMGKRNALENAPYNFRHGNLRMNLGAALGVEYNDNVNLAEMGQQRDEIFRPGANVNAFMPITTLNSVTLSLGVAPALYVEHPQYDRVLITPGSELGFDFYAGDFVINLHDRFSYRQDPISVGAVSGTAEFGGLDNTSGIQAVWDLNQLLVSAGYDHERYISSTRLFSYLNRNDDGVNARANLIVNKSLTVGVYAGGVHRYYDERVLNDAYLVNAGVDASAILSPQLRLTAGVGWMNYSFQNTSTNGPAPDQPGFSAHGELGHTVNEKFSYTLRGDHSLQMGVGAEVLRLTTVELRGNLKLVQNMSIEPRAFYEVGREVGSVATVAEHYHRYGGGLVAGWQATEKLRVQLTYGGTVKKSDTAGRNYLQDSVLLELLYRF